MSDTAKGELLKPNQAPGKPQGQKLKKKAFISSGLNLANGFEPESPE